MVKTPNRWIQREQTSAFQTPPAPPAFSSQGYLAPVSKLAPQPFVWSRALRSCESRVVTDGRHAAVAPRLRTNQDAVPSPICALAFRCDPAPPARAPAQGRTAMASPGVPRGGAASAPHSKTSTRLPPRLPPQRPEDALTPHFGGWNSHAPLRPLARRARSTRRVGLWLACWPAPSSSSPCRTTHPPPGSPVAGALVRVRPGRRHHVQEVIRGRQRPPQVDQGAVQARP